MISGHATVKVAVEAIRLGAYEFIEKPFSKEKIINYVNRGIESSLLKKEKDIIENKLFHSFDIVGESPDISKVNYSNKIKMFAINGQQDESTPPWVCKNLKDSSNNPNLYLLTYSGGHHFESRMYPPSRYDTESAHALPTCSLNYKSNLHQIIKRRDGSKEWNGEKQGYKKDQKKWFGENCIDKGTLQGYEEYGANQFWSDVKSIIVDKKDVKSLNGYTQ